MAVYSQKHKYTLKSVMVGSISAADRPDENPDAALQVVGGPLMLPHMTTAERDSLKSPDAGMMIYNTTNNTMEIFDSVGATWGASGGSGGSGLSGTTVVANIAARDALVATSGEFAYVIDASADATVGTGGATYVYDGATWIKVAEAESLDLSAYTQTFLTTDFVAGAGSYTYTLTAATHGRSSIGSIQVFELVGTDYHSLGAEVTVSATLDITITVSDVPDGRFDGKIVLS